MSDEIEELRKKIDNHEKRIETLEKIIKFPEESSEKIIKNKCPDNLLKDAGITKKELSHILYFDDKSLEFVCEIKGKNAVEQQFKATLIILTFYHYCKNSDKIKSQELREIFGKANIKSLANLSTNLKKSAYKKFVRPEGISSSPEFSYKITDLGIEKGLEIIKELILQEQN